MQPERGSSTAPQHFFAVRQKNPWNAGKRLKTNRFLFGIHFQPQTGRHSPAAICS